MSRICLVKSVRSREAIPCMVEELKAQMASRHVLNLCAFIANETDKDRIANLKKQLPAITPHACAFKDNIRKSENATPSGLVMLDVDHVADPEALLTASLKDKGQKTKDFYLENHIVLVHKTASGKGLRVIGELQPGESIPDGAKRLAALFGVAQYDAVTKDLARLSFLVPLEYVYFADWARLASEPMVDKGQRPLDNSSTASDDSESSDGSEGGEVQNDGNDSEGLFHGVSYQDIIANVLARNGGEPEVGERNNCYFNLALVMRYVTDFQAEKLFSILPSFGLGSEERQQSIRSALSRARTNKLPADLEAAIALAQKESPLSSPLFLKSWSTDDLVLPPLPRLLRVLCSPLPESYQPALIIAALPILGALATRVRFNYLDGNEHSFSFFSCVTAPAATGKSFLRTPLQLLLTPIDEQDEVEREKIQHYQEALRKAKNSKHQPDDPHACPRNNGLNISIAKFLQLMSYSGEKHLIGIGEEIDTLVKSEKRGAWGQFSDIYRLAFDNAKYGQQYMSEKSFSANVKVFYNLLVTGTPGGMYRFFKDVENGLVTRVAFAQLPDMFATEIPRFRCYTSAEKVYVIAKARGLDAQAGIIVCPKVDAAIADWLEQKRQMAIEMDSRAIDTLRRRAAVMGFRAGYLCTLLDKSPKMAAGFATWVAEYVFRTQMALFGDQFEEVAAQTIDKLQGSTKLTNVFSSLPKTFTRQDLITLRVRNGQSPIVKLVLHRWRKQGLIEEISQNEFRKLRVA